MNEFLNYYVKLKLTFEHVKTIGFYKEPIQSQNKTSKIFMGGKYIKIKIKQIVATRLILLSKKSKTDFIEHLCQATHPHTHTPIQTAKVRSEKVRLKLLFGYRA